MKAKTLYPNIAFFLTLKEMPTCPVGSMVTIYDNDGRECLWCNSIQMPLDTVKLAPDWFKPVTNQEQEQMIKRDSSIRWVSLGNSDDFFNVSQKICIEFADWYHNGLTNAERGTPEEMFVKYIEIKCITG